VALRHAPLRCNRIFIRKMPRDQRKVVKREILSEWKYHSVLIQKFINKINFRGKKAVAERIVYRAMDLLREKTKGDPVKVVTDAVEKVRPLLEVKPRRVGGATFQVPVEVRPDRSYSLALRWIIEYACQRKGKPMFQKLAEELLDAYQGQGLAIKKREDTHKMAEANRAFAHYRW